MRAIVLFGLILGAITLRGEEVAIGNLRVNWETGWSLEKIDDGQVRLTARTLELREVTILPWDNSGPMEDSLQLARIHLPALVARGHAELIEGLKEQKLPSGAIVLSTAFADKARDESYIVFVNVAPSGRTTELTIRLEGIGEAAKLISTFRAYANSAHWTNEAEENPSAHDEVITIELKFGGN